MNRRILVFSVYCRVILISVIFCQIGTKICINKIDFIIFPVHFGALW